MNPTTKAPTIMADGAFSYVVEDWARLPPGFVFGDVGGVAVDSKDNVYVFNRSEHPMMVFDRDGNFLRSWGEGLFTRPHGIHIGPDDAVWCTDDGDHCVRKCTPEGKVVMTIGIPGAPAPLMSGLPFHRCTHTALSPRGDLYVSDGYGNARVHKYSPDGKLIGSWGEPGIDPGQFNVPHNICCDAEGWVYVADRENHRIQVFDGNGKFEAEWHHVHRPCALCMQAGPEPLYYVGEAPPGVRASLRFPNLGARVTIMTPQGKILARIGRDGPGDSLGQFVAPHGMAVDSRGDLYVGEVAKAGWPDVAFGAPLPPLLRTFRKLIRQPSSD